MRNTGYSTAERKAMHNRLRELTGRWLLTEEATELEALAESLGVPLQWRRYTFQNDKLVALGASRRVAPERERTCQI
jgi:hypothetical protein